MKVIDLLVKIANGEIDYTTKFDAKVNMGYCGINEYFERYPINENYLNCEIELEDTPKEDKKIEKLNEYVDIGSFTNQIGIEDNLGFVHWSNDLKEGLDKQTNFNKNVLYKINEIIDKINGEDNE